jgi:hypothetical protein
MMRRMIIGVTRMAAAHAPSPGICSRPIHSRVRLLRLYKGMNLAMMHRYLLARGETASSAGTMETERWQPGTSRRGTRRLEGPQQWGMCSSWHRRRFRSC